MSLPYITSKDFKTFLYKASFLSERYTPIGNMDGFIKNYREISLFNKDLIYEYKDIYEEIKVFDYTEEEYKDTYKNNKNHNVVKNTITILKFDDDFFKLQGKEYSKIRYYKNYFTKRYDIEIRDEPESIDEVIDFIREWKRIRGDAHFQYFIGYDINFIKNYYKKYRNNLIAQYFYHNSKLIGYYICEKVSDTLYNQLYRKVNTNYSHLSLYVDYINFSNIYNTVKKPFLVNMEGDVSEDGLKLYKNENFPVHQQIASIDVKIFTKEQKKTTVLFKDTNRQKEKEVKNVDAGKITTSLF